jgi:hypothetical protein
MKHSALIALLCAFLAFAAADIVSRDVFERLPHLEDEFAYLYQARIFARGEAYIETPKPYRAYWQPFLINLDGKRFGKYTPGWPLVLAVGARLDQTWIVNAWLAMLTVALVYRLGREIYNPATGAVAAILTATSPGALLLNGSLMAHTAALFFTTLFLYALWRVERCRRTIMWGALGGFALGMVLIIRPLSAVGLAMPFVLYSAGRVMWIAFRPSRHDRSTDELTPHQLTPIPNSSLHREREKTRDGSSLCDGWRALLPLLALAVMAILVGLVWPAFNYDVSARRGESFPAYLGRFLSGDPDTNLYLRIWDYDRVGFGPGHGRRDGGHTPEVGWRHAQKDLRCATRDTFGWAAPADPGVTVEDSACLVTSRGYSWLLLPFGFLMTVWRRWTWLLLALPVSLIVVYIAYWIGGSLYSARYYFEGLTAVALVSAVGLTQLVHLLETGCARLRAYLTPRHKQRGGEKRGFDALSPRWALCGGLIAATIYSLAIFSPARLRPLQGYGRVSQAQIDEVNRLRREPDRPVVVIVWGEHHWREIASLMAVTDPYRDSDIVLARDPDKAHLDTLLAQWPDREKLFYVDGEFMYTLR